MSYILDALKKAETERERGGVPGLSSGPTNQATYISYGSGRSYGWLVALALAVVLVLVLGLWLWRQTAVNGLATAPAKLAASAASLGSPSPPAPPPLSAPVPARSVAPVLATVPAPAAVAPPIAALPAVAKAASTPGNPARAGIPLLAELPDSLRRQIPPLTVSGAVYSDAPAEWTLIINDQLMGKGSQVAPDLRLEEISSSSAVFNFKGQRFRLDR
jgi:general secretion pathway protein B